MGVFISSLIAFNVSGLSGITPSALQGTVMGVFNAMGSSARATGPLWSVAVYMTYGPSKLYMCVTGVMVLSSVTALLLWFANKPLLQPATTVDSDSADGEMC